MSTDRLRLDCPHCNGRFTASASLAGRIVRCSECAQAVRVSGDGKAEPAGRANKTPGGVSRAGRGWVAPVLVAAFLLGVIVVATLSASDIPPGTVQILIVVASIAYLLLTIVTMVVVIRWLPRIGKRLEGQGEWPQRLQRRPEHHG
jgi:hypothetical protein